MPNIMKSKKLSFYFIVVSLLWATNSQAGNRHEVLLSGSGGLSGTLGVGNATTIHLGAGYHYLFNSPFQFGFDAAMDSGSTTGGTGTVFSFMVGPTMNFPFDTSLKDAFFTSAGAGMSIANSNADFLFEFLFGKRFRIFDVGTYRPSIGFGIAQSRFLFILKFIAFSAVF